MSGNDNVIFDNKFIDSYTIHKMTLLLKINRPMKGTNGMKMN